MRDAPVSGGIKLPTECTGQYDTIVTSERAVQIRSGKKQGKKEKKREPEGWMDTEELRVKWLIKAPLGSPRALWGWRRPKQGRSRWGGRGAVAQRPQQEAKGTKRTRSSVVQVRLRGRPCTERWLLFARTPEGRRAGKGKKTKTKTKIKNHSAQKKPHLSCTALIGGKNNLISRGLETEKSHTQETSSLLL